MHIRLEPNILSGNDVLYAEHLSKSFDENHLFKDVFLDIKQGERVALIGNNGTGKTTILKLSMVSSPQILGRYVWEVK